MSQSMTSADHFWYCMDEPTNLMIITAFMEFEELIDFERLCATIEHRLASFPRFQKRVIMLEKSQIDFLIAGYYRL